MDGQGRRLRSLRGGENRKFSRSCEVRFPESGTYGWKAQEANGVLCGDVLNLAINMSNRLTNRFRVNIPRKKLGSRYNIIHKLLDFNQFSC